MTPDHTEAWRRTVGVDFGIEQSEPRDPSTAEMDAALPRLVSVFADHQASGDLRGAVRWWNEQSRTLDKPRRVKAQLMLGAALDRLGAGDSP